jgi:hypothetical protein
MTGEQTISGGLDRFCRPGMGFGTRTPQAGRQHLEEVACHERFSNAP